MDITHSNKLSISWKLVTKAPKQHSTGALNFEFRSEYLYFVWKNSPEDFKILGYFAQFFPLAPGLIHLLPSQCTTEQGPSH